MRVTVELDSDVASLVRDTMREGNASFDEVVNDGLRRGLQGKTPGDRVPFVQPNFDMGALLVPAADLGALASELEVEESIDRLRRSY